MQRFNHFDGSLQTHSSLSTSQGYVQVPNTKYQVPSTKLASTKHNCGADINYKPSFEPLRRCTFCALSFSRHKCRQQRRLVLNLLLAMYYILFVCVCLSMTSFWQPGWNVCVGCCYTVCPLERFMCPNLAWPGFAWQPV